MTAAVNDCFAADHDYLSTAEALRLIEQRVSPVAETERVTLRAARGRVLGEDIVAPRDVPAFDNAAVDGYAFSANGRPDTGGGALLIAGTAAAGHPFAGEAADGTAIRIFTGAPMPRGTDTVAMQEDCTIERGRVTLPAGLGHGDNRRRAGEDIRRGATVLTRGQRLRPQDVGVIASTGAASVTVYRPIRVAVFSTGDEVIDPGSDLPPGALYDSNRYMLAALTESLAATVSDLGILADRLEAVRAALKDAAPDHDLILTSGGVSVGGEDHVRAAVEDLGRLHFWRLAIKPGRPLAMGQIGAIPFVGIPGNPVAAMVTFLRFVRPLVLRLGGATTIAPHLFRVRADFEYRKKLNRREWLRARLTRDPDGTLSAVKFAHDGSGILTSMVEADGLIELPEDLAQVERGDSIDFLPFSEVLR